MGKRNPPEEAPAIATFAIAHRRYLDAAGRAITDVPPFAKDREAMTALYRGMVLTRTFDAKAVSLQRTGRLGTYASSLGQEAVAVGLAAAMRKEDLLVPSFREQGAMLWRGVKPVELLLYWGGDERGSDFAEARQDFPICVPVGTGLPHAAGVALAFKLRGEARVAVAIAGDGATSRGDVYEAMNFAAVQELPLLLVVNNNQWAISMPRVKQTAAETLAQKAVAAGCPGIQVDGNDVVAVRQVAEEAIERARAGEGPTVMEAVTYRLTDHTTADDARRYRDDSEVSARWKEEPVARLRSYLVEAGWWGKKNEEALLASCARQVEAAVEDYAGRKPMPARAMFDHLYATLPAALAAQRSELGDGGGDSES